MSADKTLENCNLLVSTHVDGVDRPSEQGETETAPWPKEYPPFPDVAEKNLDKWVAMPVKYKYYIRRTKSGNIPAYNETGHGGSRQMTVIRLVEGDPRVFTPPSPQTLLPTFLVFLSFVRGELERLTCEGIVVGTFGEIAVAEGEDCL